jgi:hypothetical protein
VVEYVLLCFHETIDSTSTIFLQGRFPWDENFLLPLWELQHNRRTIIPEFAVKIYYSLKILAATLVSRFCASTYL